MRLLQRKQSGWWGNTYIYSLIECNSRDRPSYAVLSHRWGQDEVTFQDIQNGTAKRKAGGYKKLEFCATQAARDGLVYFWVDTCCIDKTNNTELSEAINSMYKWYQNATKCYVYLPDVSAEQEWEAMFRRSQWFRRGWTLQELIAPQLVDFFSVEATKLGDKQSLERQINEITGISTEVLRGKSLTQIDQQERLSWTEGRETTVDEDAVYCLLGIFGVFMPLIYGEGHQKALIRLLREIRLLENSDLHAINYPVKKAESKTHAEAEDSTSKARNREVISLADQDSSVFEDDAVQVGDVTEYQAVSESSSHSATDVKSLAEPNSTGRSYGNTTLSGCEAPHLSDNTYHRSPTPIPVNQASVLRTAESLYASVFSNGTGAYYLWEVGTWADLVQKWKELSAGKLRLTGVNSSQVSETEYRFIGVWNELGGEHDLCRTQDWNFFFSKFETCRPIMRLLDFDIVTFGSQRWYIGCWGGSPIKQKLVHNVSWEEFCDQWEKLSTQTNPMRLTKVQVYSAFVYEQSEVQVHMTGLFEAGSGGYALVKCTDKNEFFQIYNNEFSLQFTDFNVFHSRDGETHYTGVWRETSQKHYFLRDLSRDDFANSWKEMSGNNIRLQKAFCYSASTSR